MIKDAIIKVSLVSPAQSIVSSHMASVGPHLSAPVHYIAFVLIASMFDDVADTLSIVSAQRAKW